MTKLASPFIVGGRDFCGSSTISGDQMHRQETDATPPKDLATSKSRPGAKWQKKSTTDVKAEIAGLRGEFLFMFIEEWFHKFIQLQSNLQK